MADTLSSGHLETLMRHQNLPGVIYRNAVAEVARLRALGWDGFVRRLPAAAGAAKKAGGAVKDAGQKLKDKSGA